MCLQKMPSANHADITEQRLQEQVERHFNAYTKEMLRRRHFQRENEKLRGTQSNLIEEALGLLDVLKAHCGEEDDWLSDDVWIQVEELEAAIYDAENTETPCTK